MPFFGAAYLAIFEWPRSMASSRYIFLKFTFLACRQTLRCGLVEAGMDTTQRLLKLALLLATFVSLLLQYRIYAKDSAQQCYQVEAWSQDNHKLERRDGR